MLTRRAVVGGMAAFVGRICFSAKHGDFTDGDSKLRFGVLSDLHIRCVCGDCGYYGGSEIFKHALECFRDQKVDAVMVSGDLSDLGLGDELVLVGKTWDSVFPGGKGPDGRKVEKLFITGNHESGVMLWGLRQLRKIFPDEMELRHQLLRFNFPFWWEAAFHEPYQRFYHKNVKGYDFLSAQWDDGMMLDGRPLEEWGPEVANETFGKELKEWLEARRSSLDPDKPFFYQQHRALWKSNFNDWAWNHDIGLATNVLKNWPNAVAFSGDTHYPLTDERAIWQGPFTSIGASSLRYSGLPYNSRGGSSYENSTAIDAVSTRYDPFKVMPVYNATDSKQGMIVSVYDDRIVIERLDFVEDRPLGKDWIVPLGPDKPYVYSSRAVRSVVPQFAKNARLQLSIVCADTRGGAGVKSEETKAVQIRIPAVKSDSQHARCIEYVVRAVDAKGEGRDFHVLAEGFDLPVGHCRASGETVFRVALSALPRETVKFEVMPLDCWWNCGKSLSIEFLADCHVSSKVSSPLVKAKGKSSGG